MPTLPRGSVLIALFVIVVGCTGAGPSGPPPSSSPGGGGAIEHATGPTDVLLRYDDRGGFAGPLFFASQAPIFTLCGDGRVIFRDPTEAPPPAVGGVAPNRPFRTATLSEDQIQAVLRMAIDEGGLGMARLEYGYDRVADASTTTFTLNAGGLHKTVSIYALGIATDSAPDAAARVAFAKLARRLADFDANGTTQTDEYVPDGYRAFLSDRDPSAGVLTRPWPWRDLMPNDFVEPADSNGLRIPTRVLSVAEVEALGIDPYRGGFQRLALTGPDKLTSYSLAVRPLLPDETNKTE